MTVLVLVKDKSSIEVLLFEREAICQFPPPIGKRFHLMYITKISSKENPT